MPKAIFSITVVLLALGAYPKPDARAQSTTAPAEEIVSAWLMTEADRISISRSLDVFTEQVLPTIVKEAQTRGWNSDVVLSIFGHTLRKSIQSHERSPEHGRFMDAVDDFTQSLKEQVNRVPTESARQTKLLAENGLLLNQVKDSLVEQIVREATKSNDSNASGNLAPDQPIAGRTRVQGAFAVNSNRENAGQALVGYRENAELDSNRRRDPNMSSSAGLEQIPRTSPAADSRTYRQSPVAPSLQLTSQSPSDVLSQPTDTPANAFQKRAPTAAPDYNGLSFKTTTPELSNAPPNTRSIQEHSLEMLPPPHTATPEGIDSIPSAAPHTGNISVMPPNVPPMHAGQVFQPSDETNSKPHNRTLVSILRKIWHPREGYPSIDEGTLLGEYQARTSNQSGLSNPGMFTEQAGPATNYSAWWHAAVTQPFLGEGRGGLPVNVESLVLSSMQHAPQIASLQIDPSVRETRIVEEDAEFDWNAFVEGTYDHINEPWVFNNNVLGGGLPVFPQNPSRLKGDQLNGKGGLKRAMRSGGSVEFYQQFDTLSNNQPFLNPNPANTARFELNVNKPLLRGNGKAVNQSRIVIARLNRDISHSDAISGIERHIVSVHEAYWSLYLARASLIQKMKALETASEILKIVESRQDVDATKAQLMRTRSVVAKRRADIPQLAGAIRNAQSRLRLLVNSPELENLISLDTELLPLDLPNNDALPLTLQESFQTALTRRQDICSAMKQIHRTSIELEVSKNDLLPRFDLDFYMYTAGLQRDRSSFADMYYHGPGVGAGFVYEIPIGNRRAKSVKKRSELLLTKAFKDFEVVVETGLVETEQAVNDVKAYYSEMTGAYNSMMQARQETLFAETLWKEVTNESGGTLQSLDALFDSQDRMADEEYSFVESQVKYEIAVIELKRSTGTLLYQPTM